MTKTLLEQAKEIKKGKRKKEYSAQDMELSLAWLKGEVSNSQICETLKIKGGNVYIYILRNIYRAYLVGKIKIII